MRRHRPRRSPWLLLAVALVGFAPAATRADDDAAAELEKLVAERDASGLKYGELARAFADRFAAFAERHPDTEEALTAKLWLLQQTWWQREAGTMNDAAGALADEILAGWPGSPQLAGVPDYHYVFSAEQRTRYFEKLLGSPHAEVVAAALFGLGRAGDRARLEELLEKHPDVPHHHTTFGAMAEAHLRPHAKTDLQVGRPAPEIVGATHDGKPMKLSEHRGKVVLLSFWGDW